MPENIKVAEFIEESDLPKETKFIGYSVHLPESDEFLYKYKRDNVKIIKAWCDTPETAKKFNKLSKANRIKEEISNNSIVVCLFDLGMQIVALKVEDVI